MLALGICTKIQTHYDMDIVGNGRIVRGKGATCILDFVGPIQRLMLIDSRVACPAHLI